MNKKSLIIYLLFPSILFSENSFSDKKWYDNFFVSKWNNFTVLDKNGESMEVNGRLIYEDLGEEKIIYTLNDNRFGTFSVDRNDLQNIRFAKKNNESIVGIALNYDKDSGLIEIRKEDTGKTESISTDDIRFIYFNYKDDNIRMAEFINISKTMSGGYILVHHKSNDIKTTRYNLNCSSPLCEVTSKREKGNMMPKFLWKILSKK